MKPLEIPYNFDMKLIDFLEIYQKQVDIHCIYIPPFQDHYKCAKYYHTGETGIYMEDTYPKSIIDYENHVKYINSK